MNAPAETSATSNNEVQPQTAGQDATPAQSAATAQSVAPAQPESAVNPAESNSLAASSQDQGQASTGQSANPQNEPSKMEQVTVSQVVETQTKVETTQREVQTISHEQATQGQQIKAIESQYADSQSSLNNLESQVNNLKSPGTEFDMFKPLNEQNNIPESHFDDQNSDLKNSINQESLKQ